MTRLCLHHTQRVLFSKTFEIDNFSRHLDLLPGWKLLHSGTRPGFLVQEVKSQMSCQMPRKSEISKTNSQLKSRQGDVKTFPTLALPSVILLLEHLLVRNSCSISNISENPDHWHPSAISGWGRLLSSHTALRTEIGERCQTPTWPPGTDNVLFCTCGCREHGQVARIPKEWEFKTAALWKISLVFRWISQSCVWKTQFSGTYK